MFDHSCTVAVKDMVSASNLCMTSLHKLEPEHQIKWLERFTIFNLLLAAIYTSLSFTSIDTLWGLLVETLSLPSVRTSSRRFLSAVSAKACWVPQYVQVYVFIFIQFIHVYTSILSGHLWTIIFTIILCSILHTLELHCMIFHCTVFSHLLQCHHLALHCIPWYTIIVSYIIYIMYYIYIFNMKYVCHRQAVSSIVSKETHSIHGLLFNQCALGKAWSRISLYIQLYNNIYTSQRSIQLVLSFWDISKNFSLWGKPLFIWFHSWSKTPRRGWMHGSKALTQATRATWISQFPTALFDW